MPDENKNNIHIGGSVQGGNVNIGGTQTFKGNVTVSMGDLSANIGAIPNADADQKAELAKLVTQLQEALKSVPAEKKEDAEKIAKRTQELVEEAGAAKPDGEAIEAKANLLKKAAENIQGALPVVFGIAGSIIGLIGKLHGFG